MSADGTKNIFEKIESKVNALHASNRNSWNKLNNKPSSTNDKKSNFLSFIGDLIIVLGLSEVFFRQINDFLGKGKKYEPKLKQTLIDCFNSNITCNLDDVFKSTDLDPYPYFQINISKLDFFGLLKIDSNSSSGKLFYGNNIENNLNRVIKEAIDTGNKINWNNMVSIEKDTNSTLLSFYINQNYLGKPVSSLINDLVSQINLIPDASLLLNIFDNMFGSFSYSISPKIDPRSLLNRTILNQYVDKILDGGDDLIIDDSFFSFTNEELVEIDKITQNLSNNFLEIVSCNNAESVITPNELLPILNQFITAGTYNEQISIIEAGMSTLTTLASVNVSQVDYPKFKVEFYFNVFNQLIKSLVNLVYSPQFLVIMLIYFRLSNPNSPIVYDDLKDFLKKTRNVLLCIVLSTFKLLLLLIVIPIIIKQLTTDANKERYERNKEKYEYYIEQYLALRGTLEILKNGQLLSEIISSI